MPLVLLMLRCCGVTERVGGSHVIIVRLLLEHVLDMVQSKSSHHTSSASDLHRDRYVNVRAA